MTGDQLKHVRLTLKLSVDEMSALLGSPKRTYYRYERMDAIPLTVAKFVVTLLTYPHVINAEIAKVRGRGTGESEHA